MLFTVTHLASEEMEEKNNPKRILCFLIKYLIQSHEWMGVRVSERAWKKRQNY